MLDSLYSNLLSISIGAGIFAISYVSNVCFSLFYNIKVMKCEFDREKFLTGALKLGTFIVGTVSLCVGTTLLPAFLVETGIELPEEFTSALSILAIVGLFTTTSVKYLLEAFNTMKSIIEKD